MAGASEPSPQFASFAQRFCLLEQRVLDIELAIHDVLHFAQRLEALERHVTDLPMPPVPCAPLCPPSPHSPGWRSVALLAESNSALTSENSSEPMSSKPSHASRVEVSDLEDPEPVVLSDTEPQVADLPTALEEPRLSRQEEINWQHSEELSKLTYGLPKSAWSMILFVRSSHVFDRVDNAAMLLGFLMNIFVQLTFCVILSDDHWVSTTYDTELEGVRAWRRSVGHAAINMDPVTNSSLISRLCQGDVALHASSVQHPFLDFISEYFEKRGQYLSICVLLVYTLASCKELRDIIDFVGALWGLSCERHTKIVVREDGSVRVKCLSRKRVLLGLLVAVLRTAVACVLFRSGTTWLVRTVDIETLVVNCMALSYVLEVDEIIFACFGTAKLDHFIEKLEPLKFAESIVLRNVMRPVLTASFAVFSVHAVFARLLPMWGQLHDLQHAYCAGNQDFVFSVNSTTGALHYRPTLPHGTKNSSHYLVVDELIGFRGRRAEAACEDTWNMSCDLAQCDSDASARLWCPTTCGCASPLSGLAALEGCPTACAAWRREALQALPCRDFSQEELQEMPGWRRWLRSFEAGSVQMGCEAALRQLANGAGGSFALCSRGGLAGFCPEACGCGSSEEMEGCPGNCTAR